MPPWLHACNCHRPHSGLGGNSPLSRLPADSLHGNDNWRFNRRFQLDSLTERPAYACARVAPQPYRVVILG
jgi:hypothetical protein